jgi:hypothetical protein
MNLKFKEKRICIFANYRTGSTVISRKIVENSNLPGVGELFRTTNLGYSRLLPFEKVMRNFNSMNEFVLKIMADHVGYDTQKLSDIVTRCDKIIYVYRRDFKAQALSWLAADSTASFNDLKKSDGTAAEIIVPALTSEYVNKQIDMLKNNYITMGKLYKKYPGEVICLDDFETKEPYTRKYVWSGDQPQIPDFDVEQAIFGNELD